MKILIIGRSGSGKSTLATQLAEVLELPLLHLDTLWHTTDYSAEARSWFSAQQRHFMDKESWIIDGNYRQTLPLRLAQADTIIWLQVPKIVAIFRVIRRSLRFARNRASRQEMPSEFHETLDREYFAFLHFVWQHDDQALATQIQANKQPQATLTILRTQRQKRVYLSRVIKQNESE